MGKLLITNSLGWDESLREIFSTAGFRESSHTECGDCRVTSYKKLRVDNCNYYAEGDNFVSCSGTLFYKEQFGEESLKLLLSDARTMSVTELRKNMIGSFAVAVKVGDVIRVFVDETHTYKIYYYCDEEHYLLTTTYYHIAKCTRQPIDDDAFLEKLVRSTIISRRTPYQNIYKINAREYFSIDLAKGTFKVETCALNDYHYNFTKKEEVRDTLFNLVKKISAVRSKYIHSHRIFLTGGCDSRLEYAIHLYNNDSVAPAYWRSKYETHITNGTQVDWDIVSKMAQGGGGHNVELIDVTEPLEVSFSNITPQKCNKYGEYASIYASNNKWFSIFENMNYEGVTFGCLGEYLRANAPLGVHYKKPYTLRDMIRDVYCQSNVEKRLLHSDTLYDFIEQEYMPLLKSADKDNLSIGDAYRLFIYSKFEADETMNNFSNMFVYAFPILGQKAVADANFSIPYEWKEGEYVSVSLTGLFRPGLLSYPIISHHVREMYDPSTGMVKVSRLPLKQRVGDTLNPDSFTYKLLRFIYRLFTGQLKQDEDKVKRLEFDRNRQELSLKKIEESPTLTHSTIQVMPGNEYLWCAAQVAAKVIVADTLCEDK